MTLFVIFPFSFDLFFFSLSLFGTPSPSGSVNPPTVDKSRSLPMMMILMIGWKGEWTVSVWTKGKTKKKKRRNVINFVCFRVAFLRLVWRAGRGGVIVKPPSKKNPPVSRSRMVEKMEETRVFSSFFLLLSATWKKIMSHGYTPASLSNVCCIDTQIYSPALTDLITLPGESQQWGRTTLPLNRIRMMQKRGGNATRDTWVYIAEARREGDTRPGGLMGENPICIRVYIFSR